MLHAVNVVCERYRLLCDRSLQARLFYADEWHGVQYLAYGIICFSTNFWHHIEHDYDHHFTHDTRHKSRRKHDIFLHLMLLLLHECGYNLSWRLKLIIVVVVLSFTNDIFFGNLHFYSEMFFFVNLIASLHHRQLMTLWGHMSPRKPFCEKFSEKVKDYYLNSISAQ